MLKSNENLQGGKNKKHSEMNLDDHVRELVGKHLSEKAVEDKMKQMWRMFWWTSLWKSQRPRDHETTNGWLWHPIIMSLKPDDEEKRGRYVDGKDAADQGPAQGDLKNQPFPIFLGAESDVVDRVLCQFVLVPLVLNLFRMKSHKILIMLWSSHPHLAGLPIKGKPPHAVDAPPEVSVLLSSDNLMFRSLERVCTIGWTGISNNWRVVQVSFNCVKKQAIVVILTWVNVFKKNFGIPNSFIILRPNIIQINILLKVQQRQSGIEPSPFHLQNHFQSLPDLVNLQKADNVPRDVHVEEVVPLSRSYFMIAVPFRQSCKISGFRETGSREREWELKDLIPVLCYL